MGYGRNLLVQVGRYEEAAAVYEQALTGARRAGSEPDIARAMAAVGYLRVILGQVEAGLALLREACELTERSANDARGLPVAQTPPAALVLSDALLNGLELPAAVHAVARRALGAEGPHPAGPSSARVRLTSGQWLTVQAAGLRGGDPGPEAVAVTLAPASAAELEPLRLALYDLTPREREVVRMLIQGAANDEIARALWISRYTVKDHVKAIYAKLHVTSRAELSAKLFHEHIAPRLAGQQVRQFGAAEAAS